MSLQQGLYFPVFAGVVSVELVGAIAVPPWPGWSSRASGDRWEGCGDGCRGGGACRMSPTACTHADGKAGLRGDVVDDVVGPGSVSADTGGDVIEAEIVAGAPGDVVVGAG